MNGILGLTLLLLLGGCQPKEPAPDNRLLARVNTAGISVDEFLNSFTNRPGRGTNAEARRAVLDDLILRQALVAQARNLGLDQDLEIKRAYENLLIGRLRACLLEDQLQAARVTEAAITDYYQTHQTNYQQPGAFKLAVLYLSAPKANPGKREEVRQKLALARQKALELDPNTIGFGSLAIQHTDIQSARYQGGQIGWLYDNGAYEGWRQQSLEIARQLPAPGALSDLVEKEDGFYVVKMLDRRAPSIRSLESVRAHLERTLLEAKRGQIEQTFHQTALNAAQVTVNTSVLQTLELPSHPVNPSPERAVPGPESIP